MKIGIVGLGYVGLPLAVEFGRVYETIGYDLNESKVSSYQASIDPTNEVSRNAFDRATMLEFSANPRSLEGRDVFIVAVPTPVDDAHRPDFGPLLSAARLCGQYIKRGSIVVFESTVYPGLTEDLCVPEIEAVSGMTWQQDFHVGYSPERINPGDKEHTLTSIVKVVAGDTAETLDRVADLYARVIDAGVYRAPSIKVAEAAKVIENTQRDLNIALMNELALIFDRIGVDTLDVLEAAGTKWNFLNFRPGLVGGHCIGIDPYYLITKAEMIGYSPNAILAGRRINDAIGGFVARRTIKEIVAADFPINREPIVILGLTFKEDVADVRNSKVIDIIRELSSYGADVIVHDPLASADEALSEYGVSLTAWQDIPKAAAVVLAVAHQDYLDKGLDSILDLVLPGGVIMDLKSVLDRDAVQTRGYRLWRL